MGSWSFRKGVTKGYQQCDAAILQRHGPFGLCQNFEKRIQKLFVRCVGISKYFKLSFYFEFRQIVFRLAHGLFPYFPRCMTSRTNRDHGFSLSKGDIDLLEHAGRGLDFAGPFGSFTITRYHHKHAGSRDKILAVASVLRLLVFRFNARKRMDDKTLPPCVRTVVR
uniref:Uncharacterized protein n=1 Tax=Candidatus Kentrum sp. TC TaxID=2126339 RepID=A0A451AGJ9_9GAMM|nr:MAG: hypothetical protein BECKTC1821F_GA0114240_11684 [Candidatus Kentron sp. TC]